MVAVPFLARTGQRLIDLLRTQLAGLVSDRFSPEVLVLMVNSKISCGWLPRTPLLGAIVLCYRCFSAVVHICRYIRYWQEVKRGTR